MHTGMLWFDNSKADLKTKLQKALNYYVDKYGQKPNLCLVHPLMLEGTGYEKAFQLVFANGVALNVRPYRPVLNGHIWIGIEDMN